MLKRMFSYCRPNCHRLLAAAAAGLLVLLMSLASASLAADQSFPIIDFHFHFNGSFDIDAVVNEMNALGVSKAGNTALAAPDVLALDWARRYPDRFIPMAGKEAVREFIRSEGERAWTLQVPGMLAYTQQLEAALKAGQFKAIGEINVFGGAAGGVAGNVFPADSPLMRRFWSLSIAYRVPVIIHMDARDQTIAEMERLLTSDRRGTLVWAHVGGAAPEVVRRLLKLHPNLYADMTGRTRDVLGNAEWKDLFDEYSDRFVIGTDARGLEMFSRLIGVWRKVLQQLSPSTASKLAHENAEWLLNPPR